MIHAEDINWKLVGHMALKNQYHGQYADKEIGVTMEVLTNRTKNGTDVGKSKSFYFIDKDDESFSIKMNKF